jgi:hypothetical protein
MVNALIVGVLAVISSYGWWEYAVGQQRDAVAAINSVGGEVLYDWQWSNGRPLPRPARPRWPDWVVNVLGPDFLGRVVAVNLSRAGLSANNDLISDVGRLRHLEHLTLGQSAITGKGLAPLRDLTRLKTLYVWDTRVSAADLVYLEKMVKLEELVLPRIPLSDADLAHFARLTKLKGLILSGNRITNDGLAHLAAIKDMQFLTLQQTSVTSLEPIRALTRLKQLNLAGSPIDDAGLKPASAFHDLEMLWLNQTRVTDAGMAFISGLPDLKLIDLKHTRTGDAGLRLLCGLPRIINLAADDTDVSDAGLASVADRLNQSPCQNLSVSGPRVTAEGMRALSAKLTHTQLMGVGRFFQSARPRVMFQQGTGVDDDMPK